MKIVFFGTPPVAVPALEALAGAGHEIALVVTQPDRPSGRSRTPVPPAVKRAALERGVDVLQPQRLRDPGFRDEIERAAPDALVVVAYGKILPAWLLEAGPHGAINVHFSLLPAYRGAAPVQWALARGENVTGVTTMRISERLDEGDLLLQRSVPIFDGEHAPSLLARLAVVGAEILTETMAAWATGRLEPQPQDERRASLAPALTREDGEIDPELPAQAIEGRVRGFDPWPGAWVLRGGKRLRLAAARAVTGAPERPEPAGTVLEPDGGALAVVCGAGSLLRVTHVQIEGGRVLEARAALNGRLVGPGDRLTKGTSTVH